MAATSSESQQNPQRSSEDWISTLNRSLLESWSALAQRVNHQLTVGQQVIVGKHCSGEGEGSAEQSPVIRDLGLFIGGIGP